jgi:D-alanyl-lipoteichoic acid acyltransferase DltB (MBOAT superfamily)
MRFTDLGYALFLVGTLVVARGLGRGYRGVLLWLTLASLAFYGSWDRRYLVLLGVSTVLDYGVGAALGRTERPGVRRALLWTSVAGNLALLGVFKYGDFVLEGLGVLCAGLGIPVRVPRWQVAIPIGISFYTFQTMSYSIDVYRRTIPPAREPLSFLLYVSFFPQLVAGPIVRAREFLPQLSARVAATPAMLGEGVTWILVGLVKKMLLGDGLTERLVAPFFAAPQRFNAAEAVLADWAAYFALYCDFSGYTDIAIGSALLFGYTLPRNFDRPAFAPSPVEHWRRWHMTLGTFLRDYLYLPLGGSHVPPARAWWNLFVVFLVSGIWHGVGGSYVVMGLANGILVATWRLLRPRPSGRPAVHAVESLLAFQLTALTVLCLRPIALGDLATAFGRLGAWSAPAGGLAAPAGVTLLAGVIALHLSPRGWKDALHAWGREAPPWSLAAAILLVGGACALVATSTLDFAYFQF